MEREGGNKEKMRKCRECISLHVLILSPFPLHFLIISQFSLHLLILSSFSYSQAGRQGSLLIPKIVQKRLETHVLTYQSANFPEN